MESESRLLQHQVEHRNMNMNKSITGIMHCIIRQLSSAHHITPQSGTQKNIPSRLLSDSATAYPNFSQNQQNVFLLRPGSAPRARFSQITGPQTGAWLAPRVYMSARRPSKQPCENLKCTFS